MPDDKDNNHTHKYRPTDQEISELLMELREASPPFPPRQFRLIEYLIKATASGDAARSSLADLTLKFAKGENENEDKTASQNARTRFLISVRNSLNEFNSRSLDNSSIVFHLPPGKPGGKQDAPYFTRNSSYNRTPVVALSAPVAIPVPKQEDLGLYVGVDGTADARKAILEGRLTASVAQLPYLMGVRSVTLAVDAVSSQKTGRTEITPTPVLTKQIIDAKQEPLLQYVR